MLKKIPSARCAALIVRVGEMPWPKSSTTHYYEQLGLQDKDCAINELVVCWVLHYLMPWAIEHSMFKLAWRGLVLEDSPSLQEVIIVEGLCYKEACVCMS